MTFSTKATSELTLHDRLSRLTYSQAAKLLGEGGAKLIQKGGAWEPDIAEQVTLTNELFCVTLPVVAGASAGSPAAVVTIERAAGAREYLSWECNRCQTACEHVGAAFSLILEDKMALGLAAAPTERIPIESLSDDQLIDQALRERAERALSEKMILQSTQPDRLWSERGLPISSRELRAAVAGHPSSPTRQSPRPSALSDKAHE